ncbi:unnamed protein product, partial [Mesorhabditis belari]|uniref:Ankyrin repeat and SAM domain-containing protein 6 n=1 Tax=Mesorhabditis belari TaxID=2138241 RepID=A0AAF3EV89_9BILA
MSSNSAILGMEEEDMLRLDLLTATSEGNYPKVKKLLDLGVPVDSHDDDFVTPLQIAAALGDNWMVSTFIDIGASIDSCNQVGMTAFHHACREGRLNVIETLLQRGADIHKFTFLGATGLTLATAGGHLDVVKKLVGLHLEVSPKPYGPTLTNSFCPSPLIVAAVGSSPQICGYLTSRGAPVDEVLAPLLNLTALTSVILCSRPESSYNTIVSALLDLGADPTRRTFRNGKSAIELADDLKREEILLNLYDKNRIRHDLAQPTDFRQLLRENALDQLPEALQTKTTNLPDAITPLMWAVAVGSAQGVYKLLEMRYNVDAQETKYGYSALMLAAFLREDEIVDLLLEMGAGVERTEPNTLHQTSYDLYLTATEDTLPEIRARLHRYKPKEKSLNRGKSKKFSTSGSKTLLKRFGQITQMMSKTKNQLGLSDPQEGASHINMRDWTENRIQSALVDGRNHRKLVRVEQILHRLRHISPPITRSLDSDFEAVRSLAAENATFALTTFYDHYSETHIERRVESEPTSLEYDVAMKYAKEYVSDMKIDRRPRSIVGYPDGQSPTFSLRTTPRMIKKSRDSLVLDGMNGTSDGSPGRASLHANFLFPPSGDYQQHMRKSVSTPSLPGPSNLSSVMGPRITEYHSYSMRSTMPLHDLQGKETLIWDEMRSCGLSEYVQVMIEEEIDYETFFALSCEDLNKMNIRDKETIDSIIDIQNRLEKKGYSFYS